MLKLETSVDFHVPALEQGEPTPSELNAETPLILAEIHEMPPMRQPITFRFRAACGPSKVRGDNQHQTRPTCSLQHHNTLRIPSLVPPCSWRRRIPTTIDYLVVSSFHANSSPTYPTTPINSPGQKRLRRGGIETTYAGRGGSCTGFTAPSDLLISRAYNGFILCSASDGNDP